MPKYGTIEKRLLDPARVRRIPEGFSWIDRRFLRDGWIERLSRDEILLYFFLVTVGDRLGLSYYSDQRIAVALKISVPDLVRARGELIRHDLIAHSAPLYQVLNLGPSPISRVSRSGDPASFAEILRQIVSPNGATGGQGDGR